MGEIFDVTPLSDPMIPSHPAAAVEAGTAIFSATAEVGDSGVPVLRTSVVKAGDAPKDDQVGRIIPLPTGDPNDSDSSGFPYFPSFEEVIGMDKTPPVAEQLRKAEENYRTFTRPFRRDRGKLVPVDSTPGLDKARLGEFERTALRLFIKAQSYSAVNTYALEGVKPLLESVAQSLRILGDDGQPIRLRTWSHLKSNPYSPTYSPELHASVEKAMAQVNSGKPFQVQTLFDDPGLGEQGVQFVGALKKLDSDPNQLRALAEKLGVPVVVENGMLKLPPEDKDIYFRLLQLATQYKISEAETLRDYIVSGLARGINMAAHKQVSEAPSTRKLSFPRAPKFIK